MDSTRTLTISLDGVAAELDMCAEHANEWADRLTDLIIIGRETEDERRAIVREAPVRGQGRPPSPNGGMPCPVCDMKYSTSDTVRRHLWRVHIQAEIPPRWNGPCPDCGVEFESAQGLGSHRALVHGTTWSDALMTSIEKAGYDINQLRREAMA